MWHARPIVQTGPRALGVMCSGGVGKRGCRVRYSGLTSLVSGIPLCCVVPRNAASCAAATSFLPPPPAASRVEAPPGRASASADLPLAREVPLPAMSGLAAAVPGKGR